MKFVIGAALAGALLSATPARAEPAKLTVDFGSFPKGMTCKVGGTRGRVTMKVGREIEFTIRGDTSDVSFLCTQPDGRSFVVATGPLLPPGDHSIVAVQINQDDHAHILWDQGGLRRATVPGILRWR